MTERHAWEYKRRDDMTSTVNLQDKIRELLIQADHRLTWLAIDLDRRMPDGWDPDAYYTPLEHQLHLIAEAVGLDYNKDIAAEAYRRRQEADL